MELFGLPPFEAVFVLFVDLLGHQHVLFLQVAKVVLWAQLLSTLAELANEAVLDLAEAEDEVLVALDSSLEI